MMWAAHQMWKNFPLKSGGILLCSWSTKRTRDTATFLLEVLSTVMKATLLRTFHLAMVLMSCSAMAKPVWGAGSSLNEITCLLRIQLEVMKWAVTTIKGAWFDEVQRSVVREIWSRAAISWEILFFINWYMAIMLLLRVVQELSWNFGFRDATKAQKSLWLIRVFMKDDHLGQKLLGYFLRKDTSLLGRARSKG